MPYQERSDEEMVAAIEEWAGWHPEPNKTCLSFGKEYSPRDIARILREYLNGKRGDKTEEKLFEVMVHFGRELAKISDTDPVEAIHRPIEAERVMVEVTVIEQTLSDVLSDNWEYIVWLGDNYGQEEVDRFIKELKEELAQVPPAGEKETVPMVQIGCRHCENC